MFGYIVRRIASSAIVLLVVSIITFAVLIMIPGNPAELMLGSEATPEQLAKLQSAMGLDKPYYEQYINWFADFIRMDLGTSHIYGEAVITLIRQRLPVTISVAVFSMIIATFIATILGIISAIKKDSIIDYFSRSIMQFGMAIPSFWIGMVFIVVFGLQFKIFPISGYVNPSESFVGFVRSIAMPSVVLAISEVGILLRIIRSSMLESLKQDYMDMAIVKGLSPAKVYVKYALRSAMVVPLTIIGMQFAKLVGGTVVVETVFALPGIGRLVLTAVEQRDIILLQGLVMFITAFVIFINMMVDILIVFVNPRIKPFERGEL